MKHAHLERVVDSALQQCGIFNSRLSFISDTANVIFRADAANRSYCVRVNQGPSRTIPEIYGELHWLLSLKQETNLIVPEPLPTTSGLFVQELTAPEIEGPIQVVVFHWIPGKIIGAYCNANIARQMGALMAELHTHAAAFELPKDSFRDASDWHGMGHFTSGLTRAEISRIEGFLDYNQLALCEQAAQQAASAINAVDAQHSFGLIHSDLHPHNCLSHGGKIAIIDFDDCQFAPFTCDLAITMCSFDDFPHPANLRQAFLQGYSEKRTLPKNFEAESEAFMMERRLRLVRWVSTWPSIDHFPFGRSFIHNALEHCKTYLAPIPPRSP